MSGGFTTLFMACLIFILHLSVSIDNIDKSTIFAIEVEDVTNDSIAGAIDNTIYKLFGRRHFAIESITSDAYVSELYGSGDKDAPDLIGHSLNDALVLTMKSKTLSDEAEIGAALRAIPGVIAVHQSTGLADGEKALLQRIVKGFWYAGLILAMLTGLGMLPAARNFIEFQHKDVEKLSLVGASDKAIRKYIWKNVLSSLTVPLIIVPAIGLVISIVGSLFLPEVSFIQRVMIYLISAGLACAFSLLILRFYINLALNRYISQHF